MAKYTTLLQTLIKSGYDLGMDTYPMHQESYRLMLNDKIYKHYAYREIGFETPALFKHYLNMKMNEIMPYYNQLYDIQVEFLKQNVFQNVNRTETEKGTINDKGDGSNNTTDNRTITDAGTHSDTDNNQRIYSDTPMSPLNFENVQTGKYATDVTFENNSNNGTTGNTRTHSGSTVEKTTDNNLRTVDIAKIFTGNDGRLYPSEVLAKAKAEILNIDMMIIDELNPLFMGIF